MSAKRPRRSILTEVELIGRYNAYLDIGTCLLEGKLRTATEREKNRTSLKDHETLLDYAERFGVLVEWIKTAWRPKSITARQWAFRQLADERGQKPGGVRRRLEKAEKLRKSELLIYDRVFEARQRLENEYSS